MKIPIPTFWLIVRDCLCCVHGMGTAEAAATIQTFLEANGKSTIVYHSEPFWVACALKDADANVRDWLPTLVQIYDQHGV